MATNRLPSGTKKYAKPLIPKGRVRRDWQETPPQEDGRTEDEQEHDRQIEHLAGMANERIRESVRARDESGIEAEWIEAEDLYQGHDSDNRPERMYIRDKTDGQRRVRGGYLAGSRSTLLVNITKPKTKVIVSRIKELLVPNNERPFDVDPTPVPDFDEVAKDPEKAGMNITVTGDDGAPMQIPAGAAVDILMKKAREASDAELAWIDDRFTEGKVYSEMRGVIEDAGRLGTGVLHGPMPICRKTRRWTRNVESGQWEMNLTQKDQPTSKRVRVQDCFPDPTCGESIHNGNYFNLRRLGVPVRELKAMASDPTYDRAAIAQALIEGPMTLDEIAERDTAHTRLQAGDTRGSAKSYTLWFSYGEVPAETLIAMGVKDELLGNMDPPGDTELYERADGSKTDALGERDQMVNGAMPSDAGAEQGRKPRTDESEDFGRPKLSKLHQAALASVPSIVVMLNGRPIKAMIAPLESGEFPFDVFRYEEVAGRWMGRGVPIQMRAAQLMVKSSIRKLMENGGASSGPQAVISDAIEPMDGVYEITGSKVWRFRATDLIKDVRAAMAFFDVPSMQAELLEIIRLGMELADQLTNTPMLLHGDEQVGAAPETLGGLRLFENNAMSPLRDIAKAYDDDLIIPHLGRYHEWWMEHGESENKGDSEVKALGSTALIKREEGRQFLLQIAPLKDDPAMKIDPLKWISETSRAHGYDMSLIQYSDEDWKKKQAELAKQQPPVAPQVQAAQIRAQTQAASDKARAEGEELERRHKAALADLDRSNKMALAEVTKQIEVMRLSGQENISIAEIQAMLATEAQKNRLTQEEMNLKLNPDNVTRQGI